jgi:O-antigen/teichoic acid export membrane protein
LALYHAHINAWSMNHPLMLNAVSLPVLVQQWESGSLHKFRKIYLWNAGFLMAISALPIFIITLLSPWIMGLYGESFRSGSLILILLVLAAPINALARMGTTALFGMHRAWSVFGLNVIWSATMLALATMLMPRMGASGLAIAFFSACCVLMFLTTILVFWYLRQSGQRSLSRLKTVRPFVVKLPFYILLWVKLLFRRCRVTAYIEVDSTTYSLSMGSNILALTLLA